MEQTKAPDAHPSEEWAALPWRKLEQHLYRLQKRIFKASARGDLKTVHQLQKLLMKSRSARLVAVRRVTQDNQGKKTAGVDGVKSVPPAGRLALAEAIHPNRMNTRKPKPLRRVWIPKPGKAEQRPLGIPVMYDRACQALAKAALEPQWEALFEPTAMVSDRDAMLTMQLQQSLVISTKRVNMFLTRILKVVSTISITRRS